MQRRKRKQVSATDGFQRPNSLWVVVSLMCFVSACSPGDEEETQHTVVLRSLSPDGKAEASVHEFIKAESGRTDLGVLYPDLGCGTGILRLDAPDLGLELTWLDSENLEIVFPADVPYRYNSGSDTVGCLNLLTHVIMVPKVSGESLAGSYSTPIKTEPLLAPDELHRAYLLRYDSPRGGVTQVMVEQVADARCRRSGATFYANDMAIELEWTHDKVLQVRYPTNEPYDLPSLDGRPSYIDRALSVLLRAVEADS